MRAFPTTIPTTTTTVPMYLNHTYFVDAFASLDEFLDEVERIGGVAYHQGPLDTVVVKVENPDYEGAEECRPDECDLHDD